MKDNQSPKPIYLKDYCPPPYWIDKTDLLFKLYEDHTLVVSTLDIRVNKDVNPDNKLPLVLDGGEELELKDLKLDNQALKENNYRILDDKLIVENCPGKFQLQITTLIKPQLNTRLEGLYKSNGMFCTQCEAEGFRHITFYLDRPDVMSFFTTTVEADKADYPVLLSNGNPVDKGEFDGERHWVKWEDPFRKPCYLFALVAGDLSCVDDQFVTCSGRIVDLKFYVEERDINKCNHAMQALKNSMRWDEEVYGREYDLDIYMIVAVSHFNMGAMENKGLNIFNTSCVLAHPDTTTDAGFQRVEGVIAHEYFHNWSGNRVTCRDWFQLSLKEGFTVFRDEEFSSDMGSRTVKRIEDVNYLRTYQFAEDSGPMAHPIRPASYIEMNNFYTTTVYQKGAEVVRMIHTLLGPEGFRKGCDLYFDRHDGQAVTTDDFVKSMEDANAVDLTQFKTWYEQAGTPILSFSEEFNAEKLEYTLHIKQECPPTPGQSEKKPFYMPCKFGLIDEQGQDLKPESENDAFKIIQKEAVLIISETQQKVTFKNIKNKPVPSLMRGFSAPVKTNINYSKQDLSLLMKSDSDGFNRWNAGQQLALTCIKEQMTLLQNGEALGLDEDLLYGFSALLENKALDPAMVAMMLSLPAEALIIEQTPLADSDMVFQSRRFLQQELARQLKHLFLEVYQGNLNNGEYLPDTKGIGQRALKNSALSYLGLLEKDDKNEVGQLIYKQFKEADNMTDQSSALRTLVHNEFEFADKALQDFYEQWQHESLVMDIWLGIQASNPGKNTLDKVKNLMEKPPFELTNPNKVRALIGQFCMLNIVNFHNMSGKGYQFLSDQVISLNKINPQIASRLVSPLTQWRSFNEPRQALMLKELKKLHAQADLSPDVFEVVSKSIDL